MVAKVRNLTSSSSAANYTGTKGDCEAARAKAAEHWLASAWRAAAAGLEAGRKVGTRAFEMILQGHVLGTNIRLGRKRDGKHEHRPGSDITNFLPPGQVTNGKDQREGA